MVERKNMKWENLKEILDNEFPPSAAEYEWDYIGEQVKIKDEIYKVMVTLDVTIDVIAQAQENNVDLIISHHPLIFGDVDDILGKDNFINAKYQLLNKANIGLYVIHTNADFNPNSIAYMQGLALNIIDLEQGDENKFVFGKLQNPTNAATLMQNIKDLLELNDVEFRSNFDIEDMVESVLIASGAGGSNIEHNSEVVNIIGEVKHHEWVKASETGAKIIEISHFSEKIFKNIVEVLLNDEDLDVILSEEKNGYKIY